MIKFIIIKHNYLHTCSSLFWLYGMKGRQDNQIMHLIWFAQTTLGLQVHSCCRALPPPYTEIIIGVMGVDIKIILVAPQQNYSYIHFIEQNCIHKINRTVSFVGTCLDCMDSYTMSPNIMLSLLAMCCNTGVPNASAAVQHEI